MKKKKGYGRWWFLLGVILVYLVVGLIKLNIITASLNFFLLIIKEIIPVFIFVFVLMVLIDYFISPKKLIKYFGKKTAKGWIISIVSGLISIGPLYMWYPLLNQMQKKGMRIKFITTFLYNRAIKLPLLPLLIFYFGWGYTIVLTLVMIIVSIFQGIMIEKILGASK